MNTLIVTGTPGSGKTFLAKKLSLLLNYAYCNVQSELQKASLLREYDEKRGSYIVDTAEMASFLLKYAQKVRETGSAGLIIDSHMAHFLPKNEVKLAIVSTCSDLAALKRRLTLRGYGPEKVRENLDAEILSVCESEARENGHNVLLFDSCRHDFGAFFAKLQDSL